MVPIISPKKSDLLHCLEEEIGENLSTGVWLAPHTTFRIGGKADFFYTARTPSQLCKAVQAARENGISWYLIAGGSNLVISDYGFRGLLIKNATEEIKTDSTTISAQSGVELDKVVELAYELSLEGLENLAGIPGSIGGAVYGNAGAYGRSIGEILESAVVYTGEGSIQIVGADYFGFRYRHSNLKQTREIILTVRLRLVPADRARLKARIQEILSYRRTKLPLDKCSAGSYFKNVEDPRAEYGKIPAGRLLEQAGAKNIRIGDAGVSRKHANIIVNYGGATAKDVRQVAEIMKQKVKRQFNITLEEEIQLVGEFEKNLTNNST